MSLSNIGFHSLLSRKQAQKSKFDMSLLSRDEAESLLEHMEAIRETYLFVANELAEGLYHHYRGSSPEMGVELSSWALQT